jgi:hypothetical protein
LDGWIPEYKSMHCLPSMKIYGDGDDDDDKEKGKRYLFL